MTPEATAVEAGKTTPCAPHELLHGMKRWGCCPSVDTIVGEAERRAQLGLSLDGGDVIGSICREGTIVGARERLADNVGELRRALLGSPVGRLVRRLLGLR